MNKVYRILNLGLDLFCGIVAALMIASMIGGALLGPVYLLFNLIETCIK